jgi:hypothetical protein
MLFPSGDTSIPSGEKLLLGADNSIPPALTDTL